MSDDDKGIIKTVSDTIGTSGALVEAVLLAAKREFPAGEKIVGAAVTTLEAVNQGIEDVSNGKSITEVAADVGGVAAHQGAKAGTAIGLGNVAVNLAQKGAAHIIAPVTEAAATVAQKSAEVISKVADKAVQVTQKATAAVADTYGVAQKGLQAVEKGAEALKGFGDDAAKAISSHADKITKAAQVAEEAAGAAATAGSKFVKVLAKGAGAAAIATEVINIGWAAGEAIHDGKDAGEVLLEAGKASSVGQIAVVTNAGIEAHQANKDTEQQLAAQTNSNKVDKNNMPAVGVKSYSNMAGFAHSGTDTNKLSPNYPPELGIKNHQDPSYIREQMAKTQDRIDKTPDDRSWYNVISKHPEHYEKIRVASAGEELDAYEKKFNEAVKTRSNNLENSQLAQDKPVAGLSQKALDQAKEVSKQLQTQGMENRGEVSEAKPPTVAQTKQVEQSVGLA